MCLLVILGNLLVIRVGECYFIVDINCMFGGCYKNYLLIDEVRWVEIFE